LLTSDQRRAVQCGSSGQLQQVVGRRRRRGALAELQLALQFCDLSVNALDLRRNPRFLIRRGVLQLRLEIAPLTLEGGNLSGKLLAIVAEVQPSCLNASSRNRAEGKKE